MNAEQSMIRAAIPADLEQVAAIYAHYVTTSVATFEEVPPTLADWRLKSAYRHTVEDTVYVSPAHVGRGLGSALLGALLTACADAGARQVIAVIADTGSDASAALHQRFGFAHAGRLAGVGRKHGRWIDTVLMQRELGPQ
jgi:L-amino acid N-acyltransferase YncA